MFEAAGRITDIGRVEEDGAGMVGGGELGKIRFLQGSHHQDMDGWPDGWPGLPPMYYAAHCIAPCLAIVDREAEYESCFGSGRIRDDLAACYGSPFAIETAHIALKDSDLCARV